MEPKNWKPMNSVGSGVNEIRIQTDLENRVLYVAKFEEGVYVLHAFEKRTRKTSRKDIDLAQKRLRDLIRERNTAE